jgi:solute carrier family 25 2-oxodicarboxylate transporter 21
MMKLMKLLLVTQFVGVFLAPRARQHPRVGPHHRPRASRTRTPTMAAQPRSSIYPKSTTSALFSTLAPISSGCIVSAFFMYPFDVVRALRMASASDAAAASLSTSQLVRNFVSAHGVKGLVSQGVAPEMARATMMRVVQFFSYPLCHEALTGKKPSEGTPVTKLVSGMAASLPSALAITPLENAKIALQLDSEKRFGNSMGNAARHLWRRGILAPYVGLQGVFTRSAISFGPYIATLPYCQSFTKPMVSNTLGDGPFATVLGNLLGGLLAGSFGAALNCPFDLVRTNLQKQAIGA